MSAAFFTKACLYTIRAYLGNARAVLPCAGRGRRAEMRTWNQNNQEKTEEEQRICSFFLLNTITMLRT